MKDIFSKILVYTTAVIVTLSIGLYLPESATAQNIQTETTDFVDPDALQSDTEGGVLTPSGERKPRVIEKNSLNETDDVSIPAQIPELKEQISINITPEVPAPFDDLTIEIQAYGTDLNRAEFVWYVNKVQKQTGIGSRIFTTSIGGIGSQNDIRVEIAPVSGPKIVRNFSFTPGEVDLIWEAQTYTPPFYKGKALFSPEAKVDVIALPNLSTKGSRLNPKSAAYNWRFDYRADASKSGYGKDVYTYEGSILKKDHLFQVESYDPRNTATKGVGKVTLKEVQPSVLLYYTDPLLGTLFNKQATNLFLNENIKELSVSAFPLYQSVTDRRSGNYLWYLNGDRIDIFNDQPTVSLRKEDVGDNNVRLRVDSSLTNKILQTSQNEVNIIQ